MQHPNSEPVKIRTNLSAVYVRSKLLNNFFKIVLSSLILFFFLTNFVEVYKVTEYPFLPTISLVAIQYYLFRRYQRIDLSTIFLLITLNVPLGFEVLRTGGLYSENLLYFLQLIPLCVLLLNIRQTLLAAMVVLGFVYYLYYLETQQPGYYLSATNLDPLHYYNAITWVFISLAALMLTSAWILRKIFRQLEIQKLQLMEQHQSLREMNNKLVHTEQSLRKSNKALEQFAHATAHDLKQPLRTMSSFAHLTSKRIKKLGIEDKSVQEYLDFIQSGSIEMTQLVEQLMDYAKVKANNENTKKPIKIRNLVERIIIDLNLTNEYPHTQMIVKLENIELQANPARVRQLFQNLISNALKFSANANNPQVLITATEKSDAYYFCVKDNGIGIDPANHDKIFQLFVKMNASSEYKGSGIGLSTCKEIIEQVGGKMKLESDLGKGCKICFMIPKEKQTMPTSIDATVPHAVSVC